MSEIKITAPAQVTVTFATDERQITNVTLHQPGLSSWKVTQGPNPTAAELLLIDQWPWADFTFEPHRTDFRLFEVAGIDAITNRPVFLTVSADTAATAIGKGSILHELSTQHALLIPTANEIRLP